MNVESLYSQSLVWDAHAGIFPSPDLDLNILEDWHQAGVNYLSINVGFDVMDWQQTLATLAAYRRGLEEHTDRFQRIERVSDIEGARQSGKLAVSFDIEGMNALNGDTNMVSVFHALGVRQMLFAYNLNNLAAGGCHDQDIGLTDFGRQVVREMNRLGVIVDCSHAGFKTTMEIMEESDRPVVFSHSNPVSIWNHQRNIVDDQIKACADTGGVVGINGLGIFLGDNDISNQTILRHILYISELVGPEHIGFGLDYSPPVEIDIGDILASRPDYWPAGQQYDTKGIEHAGPHQLGDIAALLEREGFGEAEVSGMLGGNFMRVAGQVWR